MKKILFAFIVFIPMVVMLLADGAITATNTTIVAGWETKDLYWNSLTNRSDGTITLTAGTIERVTIAPIGTVTNNYVVKITDGNGVDVLAGQGVTTSNVTHTFKPAVRLCDAYGTNSLAPIAINSSLTVAVTNTGIGKGKVSLIIKP